MTDAPIAGNPGQSAAMGRWGDVIETTAVRLSEAISRNKYVFLVLFSILYLLQTWYFASRKLFWFDELFTVYISRLPDLASIWHALLDGTDANPPLLYLLVRFSQLLLGEGPVAARLPSIVGFGILCLCLFRFVSIRSSTLAGFVSMLFPLVTGAHWYAYEARSYGAVLGFFGIALICWQGAALQVKGRMHLIAGLAAALACAALTHSYAVLLFLPIVFGELARSASRRRVDWPVWGAIVIASTAMLPSFILLRSVLSAMTTLPPDNFFTPTLPKLVQAYQSYLNPAEVVLLGALVLMLVAQTYRTSIVAQPIDAGKHESHEFVALFTLVAVPVLAYLAAKLTGAPFVSRYGIASCAGFAALLGIAMASRPAIATGLLFMLVAQIGTSLVQYARNTAISEPSTSRSLSTWAPSFMLRYDRMASVPDKELPIVLVNSLDFAPTFYYAPASLAARLTYLVRSKDDEDDVNGLIYLRLQKCCNALGNVAHAADFLSSHDRFLVYGDNFARGVFDPFLKKGESVDIRPIPESKNLHYATVSRKK